MRYSHLFAPTLKEPPKDAVLKSHKYLVQAGFIQQIGSGVYSFLPLGQRVLKKIIDTIDAVMQAHGAQSCLFNFVTPAALWQESGRLEKYGKELLVFKDRKENDFVLGPTHEEVATQIAKAHIKSYKQLPLNLYQIHTKFRDEIRPRFGLMRAREFIMKDAYSFHTDLTDLDREFANMQEAYNEIFDQLGLKVRPVEADSGAIGGSKSKEFVLLSPSGEDTLVACSNCAYVANVEVAKRAKREEPLNVPQAAFAKFPTPNTPTIEAVSAYLKVDPFFILKAVVKKVLLENNESQTAIFFVRGDDSLEETKALNACKALVPALSLEDMESAALKKCGLFAGYIGPYGLKHLLPNALVFFDTDLQEADSLICGANEEGAHFVGVDLSSFEGLNYQDIATAQDGQICALCGGVLEHHKSIEVGHIFKLGSKYSQSLGAQFLDQEGRACCFEMGCYGIGVSRLLAAILEQNSDEKGCVWSEAVAPFKVVIINANTKDPKLNALSETLYSALLDAKVETLLDDRPERFGAKMADFELIGCSYALIVGNKAKEGVFELIKRHGLEKKEFSRQEVLDFLQGA
ncbi:proline--tRNA ligase [Helicobacter ailurogastricus]|uniref:Proline--tRNA ligase n=1 Tax=Helicobacter ailurogastricus TaxID=1578720 RepID=A0A0K2XCG8_9HELI|nr:proline--tRNA ligase [Helicobacter ailurogastricus]CRF41835.1 Prolyl-tRNA synthetase, bacterial type [Helicobacter ailurogastricus]CRF43371.1 Prolyl-tRNA synthetase, bacterial type [Helicobacter ailurogastricus]CRF45025.1 Prolyl-tRNA synthetase, bacterial type [Helicobacter ailurogastricus]